MRRVIDNDWLTLLSRLMIGGVFIAASFYKIIDPGAFAKSIWYYHLTPGYLINLMALILPWLELLLGLGLIVGFWYRGSIFWATLLMMVFIAALGSTIARGINIDCGCFKASEGTTRSAWSAIIPNFAWILFCGQLWLSRSRRWLLQKS